MQPLDSGGEPVSTSPIRTRSINSLLNERFHVPAYQRGYRWTKSQVRDLLEDIWDFQAQAEDQDKSAFYCLQPIVVLRRDSGEWELVDGQQRLTTIFLILSSLKPILAYFRKQPFTLSFETRPTSALFLQDIQLHRAGENIDFFHICQAYKAIEEWFNERDGSHGIKFLQCLLNGDDVGKNVKVIWYELSDAEDPVQAFARLNVGKIPLTNAELIRGLFLREGNFANNTGHLERIAIAQEWDEIEKVLQDDDVWYFLHNGTKMPSSRIGYLFHLIARETIGNAPLLHDPHGTFHFYNEKLAGTDANASREWLNVKQYFMRLHEWFVDRTLYHLIGYLVHEGDDLLSLKAMATAATKTAFRRALKRRIFQRLIGREMPDGTTFGELRVAIGEHLQRLDYERASERPAIKSVLLLFNIAALLESEKTTLRFPFSHFKKEMWDIEHIRAIATLAPSTTKERQDWLTDLLDYLGANGDANELQIEAAELQQILKDSAVSPGQDFSDRFQHLYNKALDTFDGRGEMADDNAIGNLTLLDSATNRGYRNAVFPVKRKKIIDRDRHGVFVPLCTKNVFMKYFSKRIDSMTLWTTGDREDYLRVIVESLAKLFLEQQGEQK
jgi:hypothetical protein